MSDRDRGPGATRVAAMRGAIDVRADTADAIRAAVKDLVRHIGQRNNLDVESIISAQFTVTPDLKSIFPASAAREAGWTAVPMLCATTVDVPGALPRCIRVLVHASVPAAQSVEHVYLGGATSLRPDLQSPAGGD
jgi:chorismate mutase